MKHLGDQTGFVFINFCLKTNIPLYLRLLVVLNTYNLLSLLFTLHVHIVVLYIYMYIYIMLRVRIFFFFNTV